MKLGIIYGTRPEYLKLVCLIKKIPCKVIRISQHDTIAEKDLIYDELLTIDNVCENRLDNLGSKILEKLGPLIKDFTHILVQGDTSTVFYSALCAYQNNVKVIHLEAGLRTYDIYKPYPEEGYRQMISRIASIHLCPHRANSNILVREKIDGEIYTVGNTILDLVKSYDLKTTNGKKILITFHRRENVQYLEDFIRNLNTCSDKEFVWFLHPNKELQTKIKTLLPNCEFVEPCGHREFLEYVKDCYCVLTDSGGIQEECAFLGKPCIVLRHFTERDQIPEPYLYVCKPPYNNLKSLVNNIPSQQLDPCYVYGRGNSVDLIIKKLNINMIPSFNGGWSYTQKEMTELFKHISLDKIHSILEFGSGDSTEKLYKYIQPEVFYTYESDNSFIPPESNVKYMKYDINEIDTLVLPDIKFDLILIDGPNGEYRSKWYSKIRKNVKQGTVLLIDDFNHYKSFSDELDKNFKYDLLSFRDEPFVPYGEHSWKIVSIQTPI